MYLDKVSRDFQVKEIKELIIQQKAVVIGGTKMVEVKKGAWSPEEDRKLVSYIRKHGIWNWNQMPKFAGLARTGKSCRLRWVNYLRPDIKRGSFTMEEVDIIIKLYQSIGNRWSAIAAQLPGRSDNEIKNFYHTHLKKHILRQVEKDNTTLDDAKIASGSTNNGVPWVGEFKEYFVEKHEEECKLFGSVVILESNPSIVENDCGSSEDYYDVNAFWYDILMEAEYLKF